MVDDDNLLRGTVSMIGQENCLLEAVASESSGEFRRKIAICQVVVDGFESVLVDICVLIEFDVRADLFFEDFAVAEEMAFADGDSRGNEWCVLFSDEDRAVVDAVT